MLSLLFNLLITFCFVLISLSLLLGFLFLLSAGMLSDLESAKPYYQLIS
jgi:hypothetical protein